MLTTDRDSRMWAMFCHLAALAGYTGIPFGNVIGPLVVWLIKKDDHLFIDDQGKEAINFQISMTIYLIVAGLLCFVLIGIPLLIFLAIAQVILIIIAAVKANSGELYRYPFAIRFFN
jgi:uncharacterized Tic20 family protein